MAAEEKTIITKDELKKHKSKNSLWMAIDGKVYDVTAFVNEHPGGIYTILSGGGKDSTKAFHQVPHSPAAQKILKNYLIGILEGADNPLDELLNVADFERKAIEILQKEIARYYLTGAEDGLTIAENLKSWNRYLLRPRVLVDVSNVDLSVTVLGQKLNLPILSAPTALLKMAHEQGETGIAKATHRMGIGNILSTTATYSIEDVANAAPEGYRWFQLYVYKNKKRTERLVKRAESNGFKAIVLTVDLPVLGNRETLRGWSVPDKYRLQNVAQEKKVKDKKNSSKAGDRSEYVKNLYSQNLSSELVEWLGSITSLPILIKGVLRGDDAARICSQFSFIRGVIVSNHGGRQLDGAISPLTALPDVLKSLEPVNQARKVQGLPPVEVLVDGGVRRGRDIFKALALGAKAVLLGRPLIWGLAVGGDKGVERVLTLLKKELTTCMQLCGTRTTSEIDQSFLKHASLL